MNPLMLQHQTLVLFHVQMLVVKKIDVEIFVDVVDVVE
tara:strand:- start:292 stop:405 length:114 start_codon:yes stop_codon:yes gene_type:complete